MNETDLLKYNEGLFQRMVGQTRAKRELRFYLDSYVSTRQIPNTIVIAPKGYGKTLLSREIARGLYQFDSNGMPMTVPSKTDPSQLNPQRKPLVEINCATLTTVDNFINEIIIPRVVGKDITLFFDEAGEIPHEISMALLTALEPDQTITKLIHNEYVCEFNMQKQSFLFATTESHKVFHALISRLERISLEDYTLNDLAIIIQNSLSDIKFDPATLMDIASVVRGSARGAKSMVSKIKIFLRKAKYFGPKEWAKLREILSIVPLGLNALEMQVLRYLAQNVHGTPLTTLSAKTGMTTQSLQKDIEMYLRKHSLMEVSTSGRLITTKGLMYLKNLDDGLVTPSSIA